MTNERLDKVRLRKGSEFILKVDGLPRSLVTVVGIESGEAGEYGTLELCVQYEVKDEPLPVEKPKSHLADAINYSFRYDKATVSAIERASASFNEMYHGTKKHDVVMRDTPVEFIVNPEVAKSLKEEMGPPAQNCEYATEYKAEFVNDAIVYTPCKMSDETTDPWDNINQAWEGMPSPSQPCSPTKKDCSCAPQAECRREGKCGCAEEPKNNDGRTDCFWCASPVKHVQGLTGTYTVCTNPKCGR